MKAKRIILVAICILALLGTAGWAQAKKLKFGFSVATLDNPYFIEVANGFKDQCKKLGVEAIVTDGKYDATAQNDQFENFIAMGCQAIGAAPVDQRGLQAVTQKAKDKGIIVISEAQKIDNADGHVIVDDYGYGVVNGTNAAKWINNKLGGKAEVLLSDPGPRGSGDPARRRHDRHDQEAVPEREDRRPPVARRASRRP